MAYETTSTAVTYGYTYDDIHRLTQSNKDGVVQNTRTYDDLDRVTDYKTFNSSGTLTEQEGVRNFVFVSYCPVRSPSE